MKAASENYKGIEYIQISSLPTEQQKHILKTINKKLVITILKGDTLLNDCVQYQHYLMWHETIFKLAASEKPDEVRMPQQEITLAFQ